MGQETWFYVLTAQSALSTLKSIINSLPPVSHPFPGLPLSSTTPLKKASGTCLTARRMCVCVLPAGQRLQPDSWLPPGPSFNPPKSSVTLHHIIFIKSAEMPKLNLDLALENCL